MFASNALFACSILSSSSQVSAISCAVASASEPKRTESWYSAQRQQRRNNLQNQIANETDRCQYGDGGRLVDTLHIIVDTSVNKIRGGRPKILPKRPQTGQKVAQDWGPWPPNGHFGGAGPPCFISLIKGVTGQCYPYCKEMTTFLKQRAQVFVFLCVFFF